MNKIYKYNVWDGVRPKTVKKPRTEAEIRAVDTRRREMCEQYERIRAQDTSGKLEFTCIYKYTFIKTHTFLYKCV